MSKATSVLAIAALAAWIDCAGARAEPPMHAIAMHGEPKYPAGFQHFDYVNPDAPKGGTARLAGLRGTFDSLNVFILKGVPADGLSALPAQGISLTDMALVTSSADEAFSHYGSIAESVEMPDDRSWILFTLNPEARFHDGKPITAEDVIFSLDILRDKGHPLFRSYYADVAKAEAVGERKGRFTFAGGTNRELPLIMGELPILPKHYWQGRDFGKTTLDPPLGSGPYRIAAVDPGRSITYQRVADWWAKDLPVNRGRWNFETIRYDYYRDRSSSARD